MIAMLTRRAAALVTSCGAAALLALTATPGAHADSALWGSIDEGRYGGPQIKLVRSDAGIPTQFRIDVGPYDCRRLPPVPTRAHTIKGFDTASREAFEVVAAWTERWRAYRLKTRVHLTGVNKDPLSEPYNPALELRWTGEFRRKIRVFYRGRKVDTCAMDRAPWKTNGV